MNFRIGVAMLAAVTTFSANSAAAEQQQNTKKFALAIHGGAGTILKKNMSAEAEAQFRAALTEALQTGYKILNAGGSSLDAVEATVRYMEDSPLFNAGKGAVFTHDGKNELDAAIMDGATMKAGSVAGLTIVKNPISAARAVMEKSPHVMMIGRGAELFATQQGLEIVDPAYFWTERRWKGLQQELLREKSAAGTTSRGAMEDEPIDHRLGTVGAVAVDSAGNLAAATSTGGMTNKRFGRVGDVPIIGAGTYASNESCAVSATGHGEFFIRYTVAHEIAALVKHRGMSVTAAADQVVNGTLKKVGGEGGVIAIDRQGNIALPFNSEGMYRGSIRTDGVASVAIYKNEE